MTSKEGTRMVTASYILDTASYTEHGAFADDSEQWGTTFRELGGEWVSITPSWAHGLPVGGVFMEAFGTEAAIAFVDNTLAPVRGSHR